MNKKITFSHREPIGSSTYPMPNDPLDKTKILNILNSREAWNTTSSVYIHIPFCDQICSFCAFNKFVSSEDVKEDYVKALLVEMEMYARLAWTQSISIPAVYIGGGTPNSLSADQLDRILSFLVGNFPLTDDCQITCEGTPMNFTEDRIAVLKKNGVFRVSAGIQTFNRDIRIEHLHMREGKEELLEYIDRIARNFNSFNLDMIFNLPNQTDEIWNDDLETVLATPAKHLTIYPLVLLEKTMFYSDYVKKHKHQPPSEEREIELFKKTLARVAKTKFHEGRYTVRDWAHPGYECKYIHSNSSCNHVLAMGAGAHGFIGGFTYKNEKIIKKYISSIVDGKFLPIEMQRFCSREELMQRFMVMGLRLLGLDLKRFEILFGSKCEDIFGTKLVDMVESGYITISNSIVNYTPQGEIWANNVRTYFEGAKGSVVGYSDTASIGESGKDHYGSISRVKATDAEVVK